jgi:hypothetical protein
LRRRDVLTLRRERFDGDALAPNRGASTEDQIASCVVLLTVGNAHELILSCDEYTRPDFECAGRVPALIEELFYGSPGEFIAADVSPGSVLLAGGSLGV